MRSFSVYSWNFRMVLRRLHAEYGVNAFFRVDVVAHPNFADKSIVRVSLSLDIHKSRALVPRIIRRLFQSI